MEKSLSFYCALLVRWLLSRYPWLANYFFNFLWAPNKVWRGTKFAQAFVSDRYMRLSSNSVQFKKTITQESIMRVFLLFQILFGFAVSWGFSASYNTVPIGGGGYITGIVSHPLENNLTYIRSDVAGAYRWHETDKRWIALNDKMGYWNRHFYSVESIAIDPRRVNDVYIAVGEWSDNNKKGTIYKSTNKGNTWSKLNLDLKMGGNEDWRWKGERLAVDPRNSNVLYFGSRWDGLWRSLDGGANWSKLTIPSGSRLSFVLVSDHGEALVSGRSKRVVIGVVNATDGWQVFQSWNGGQSWSATRGLSGTKANAAHWPIRAAIDSSGAVIVTFMSTNKNSGGVYKLRHNGSAWTWSDIGPVKNRPYCGVSVKPGSSSEYIVSIYTDAENGRGVYRTANGGSSWTKINKSPVFQMNWLSYAHNNWYNLMGPSASAVIYDARTSGRVWMTDWFSVWRTDNINNNSSAWNQYVRNYESMVGFTLLSTKGGNALLFSGFADMSGFRHTSLSASPGRMIDKEFWPQDITSYAMAENNNNVVYAVGGWRHKNDGYGVRSTDNGVTWSKMNLPYTGARNGRIRTASHDQSKLIWIPQGQQPYRSANSGASWTQITALPASMMTRNGGLWTWHEPLDNDKIWSGTFYAYDHASRRFYVSYDFGVSWHQPYTFANSDPKHVLKANPGKAGEVFIGFEWNGLWKGRDSFQKVNNVQWVFNFAFGKGNNNSTPAIFVYGKVNNQEGLFVSYDMGANWKRLYAFGAGPMDRDVHYMEGDRRTKGIVYIATGGRSIVRVVDN